jgi:hypothetical protein
MKDGVRYSGHDGGVGRRVGSRNQQAVARADDSLGDRRNLFGRFAGTEHDLGKTLPQAAMMVDAGEAEVFERGLAQELKDAMLRRLRRNRPALDVLQQGAKIMARQCNGGSKCLTRVDFQLCRSIESSIVPREGFILL